MENKIFSELKNEGVEIIFNEELKKHTTLKIGGPAKCFLTIKSKQQLVKVLKILNYYKEKYFIIGAGSNLLVSDEGYDGFILKLAGDFVSIKTISNNGTHVYSGAGTMLAMLTKYCIENSLGGLEKLFGIPGTIGGAIWMNAGVKDCNISDRLEFVEIINFFDDKCEISNIKKNEIKFQYRSSGLKNCIILGAGFNFKKTDKKILEKEVSETLLNRTLTQPLENFNAGCVFKNPQNSNLSAGALIEQCGLKGYKIGDAVVSEKHANFIINIKNATAKDFISVIKHVHETVKQKFNISLELELELLNIKI